MKVIIASSLSSMPAPRFLLERYRTFFSVFSLLLTCPLPPVDMLATPFSYVIGRADIPAML